MNDIELRKWSVEQAVKSTLYCTQVNPDFLKQVTQFFYDFVKEPKSIKKGK